MEQQSANTTRAQTGGAIATGSRADSLLKRCRAATTAEEEVHLLGEILDSSAADAPALRAVAKAKPVSPVIRTSAVDRLVEISDVSGGRKARGDIRSLLLEIAEDESNAEDLRIAALLGIAVLESEPEDESRGSVPAREPRGAAIETRGVQQIGAVQTRGRRSEVHWERLARSDSSARVRWLASLEGGPDARRA